MGADAILKATMVDGVYTADPKLDPKATRYETVSFQECIGQRLKVMDSTAFSLCMDNDIPIIVFDFFADNSMTQIMSGDYSSGTIVK